MKLDRLCKRGSFREAALVGHKVFMSHFIFQVIKVSLVSETITVGITASRRVGNAVLRNRAKRRLRVLEQELLAYPSLGGTNIVLVAKPSLPDALFSDLVTDMNTAATRALRYLKHGPKRESP